MTGSSEREPESIDILCKRLGNARDRCMDKKKKIFTALYDKLLEEHTCLIEHYFKAPALNDITNPLFVESNMQIEAVYKDRVNGIDSKVLVVGHDPDGCIGVRYEKSIADAEAVAKDDRIFNGPVAIYQFKVVSYTERKSGRILYADKGKGRIVLRPYSEPEPKTERYLPAVNIGSATNLMAAKS